MLGSQWQIYSYAPSVFDRPIMVNREMALPSPEVVSTKESGLPVFLHKVLKRVAANFQATYDEKMSHIESRIFYLDVGYDEDRKIVRVYSFGVKDKDNHDKGLGKEILQYFFDSLAIISRRNLDVTLWSVHTAIGFYLRCGMLIQKKGDVYNDPVESYYTLKRELFGDEWDKYVNSTISMIPTEELSYDDVYPLFEKSDFYREGDHPGVFSMWLGDVLGDRSHHMIKHIATKRSPGLTFKV
jgi:hypothetical protein